MDRFRSFVFKVSKNHPRSVLVLKCDIRKFFASIDQGILMHIIARYVPSSDIQALIGEIVGSFHSTTLGKGLPLGNLTSQLLVNIYMNEFDQFVKHRLKARYYVRYADDFVIMSKDQKWLEELIPRIAKFLEEYLALSLHPDKVYIKTLASGVDFLGWVHFRDHRVLRTSTKRRMLKKLRIDDREAVRESYGGLLVHGNAQKLSSRIKN